MAVIPGKKSNKREGTTSAKVKQFANASVNFLRPSNLHDFLLNPQRSCWILAVVLMVAEVLVNLVVIHKVKYTEIDWVAYMQEVEGVVGVNGTTDYSQLKGDTGPLVYPGGFVWFYTGLYYLTSKGQDIRTAQYFFALVYLLMVGLVFRLLLRTRRVPNLLLIVISCTSYRIHSICVLRLFNDPVAMVFLYAAINAFADDRWSLGSLLYSLAVSIKMNILLFAPALFLAYLATQGIAGTVKQLMICASVQLAMGAPFLLTYPLEYLVGAFNLGRVFMFKWTVNWRFIPEEVFVSRAFHIALLAIHLLLLAAFAKHWWNSLKRYAGDKKRLAQKVEDLLVPLFTCNFIGVACARSLHYQFYVWYYHQLHLLCWVARPHRWNSLWLLVLGMIELSWNTYPSTEGSSLALHASHLAILLGIAANAIWPKFDQAIKKVE